MFMEKFYMVFDMNKAHLGYNVIGIAPRNQEDLIGKGVVEETQKNFEGIQYLLAGVIVFCAILVSVMIYCFCKMNIKDDEDSMEL
jgi:hypothetical protein